ncbi:MAG TPA: cytochrome P460 family protein [Myxococcota bacterium]|nr:cytochrome P460 family protein [Myxococcota bacterium]
MGDTRSVGRAVVVFALAFGALSARADDALKIPRDFKRWYLVNSMVVTKDSPLFAQIGGLHLVYVNSVGFARLKSGGSAPYPDGTIFADDVRDFSLADGSYSQGPRKAITVMVKDAKKYAATGGWGWQAWAGGDPKKPLVTDPVSGCFACHSPQQPNDFVFSTYLDGK